MGFVRTVDLFDAFELKKKLSSDFQNIERKRKGVLDSLKIQLLSLESRIKTDLGEGQQLMAEHELRYEEYARLKEQFSTEHTELEGKYNDMVWTQLNQYISDYGEENNVKMIFGASGAGNLMYSEPGLDLTDDLITYSNNRYSGVSSEN